MNERQEPVGKLSPRIEELREKVRINNHQYGVFSRIWFVIKSYWPMGNYMLRKFGWRSWYTFWYTKLFVADEGGELALWNPLLQRFPWLLRAPFKLEMEHTTACDKKCFFCEHTWWEERAERITYEWFRKITDPVKSLKWMNITGEGSTFLNKEFMKIITYLREERGCNVNFVDEMDFLNEDIARKIVELGINSIYVSFDGATKEGYESMKEGCDFDKALANIRTLVRVKEEMNSPFPQIHFRFIITRKNYTEISQYMDLMHSLKGRGVLARVELIGLLAFPGIEEHYIPFHELPEQLVVDTLQKALDYDIHLRFAHEGKLPSMDNCVAWAEPYVLIGGEVISCCAILMSNKRKVLRDNSFGNVYDTPLLDIWKTERYQKFRKQVVTSDAPVPASCYGCRAFDTQERALKYGVDDMIVKEEKDVKIKGVPVYQHVGEVVAMEKIPVKEVS